MDEKFKDYILAIVFATRFPEKLGLSELKAQIQVGASPRATLRFGKGEPGKRFHSSSGICHSGGREVDRVRCSSASRFGFVRG